MGIHWPLHYIGCDQTVPSASFWNDADGTGRLTSTRTCHIVFLCRFTTLYVHNSVTLISGLKLICFLSTTDSLSLRIASTVFLPGPHYLSKSVFGRPFVKRFAVCYRTVVCLSCPVCDVGVLWPNRWMDQDATWYGGRPRPAQTALY